MNRYELIKTESGRYYIADSNGAWDFDGDPANISALTAYDRVHKLGRCEDFEHATEIAARVLLGRLGFIGAVRAHGPSNYATRREIISRLAGLRKTAIYPKRLLKSA